MVNSQAVRDFWQDLEELNRRKDINSSKVSVPISLISASSHNEEKMI
jgi:hypothetical protein